MSNSDTKELIVQMDEEYWIRMINHIKIPKYYKEYFYHVYYHRRNVWLAWEYIGDTLCELDFINENDMESISSLIIIHDHSKLYKDEFIPYAKKFYGPKKNDPIVKENFKKAVKLHKMRNLHHYESLKSYKGEDWKYYAIELICDYIAMGWEFDSYVNDYFEKVKDELKNNLPENYYNYIESIMRIIPEELYLSNKPLTRNIIDYINYIYNRYNSPFDEEENIKELKKARMF